MDYEHTYKAKMEIASSDTYDNTKRKVDLRPTTKQKHTRAHELRTHVEAPPPANVVCEGSAYGRPTVSRVLHGNL